MAGRRSERRLATVLFLDIVDSTQIAGEVGDRRWRELLGAFRRRVRAQLRRHHGHEQDTAGDGFFATFDRPADAVRAAAAILLDAHGVGLDLRAGLHTGELERIDGRPGGIAAHIGARVMARAGAAEVLVTATVRELVIGGGMEFGTSDETELKGVPGLFRLYLLRAVDGEPLPPPLTREQAAVRLLPQAPPLIRRTVPLLAGTAALSLVALAVAAGLLLRPGAQTPAAVSSASPELLVTLLKVDPKSNKIVAQVRDRHVSVGATAVLRVVDGTLWQITPLSIVRRDIDTGAATAVIEPPPETWAVDFAFGSIWAARLVEGSTYGLDEVDRINPINGKVLKTIDPGDWIYDWAITRQAIWILTGKAHLLEVDPNTNEVIDHGTIPHEERLWAMTAVGDKLWICECGTGRLIEFDPSLDKVSRRVTFASGFPIPDERVSSQGAVTTEQDVMWLLDEGGGTITPVDAKTGKAGSPLGVPRPVSAHAFGFGALWLAAAGDLHRVNLENGHPRTIEMPDGLVAGGVALDEQAKVVWVSTCVPAMAAPNQADSSDPCSLTAEN